MCGCRTRGTTPVSPSPDSRPVRSGRVPPCRGGPESLRRARCHGACENATAGCACLPLLLDAVDTLHPWPKGGPRYRVSAAGERMREMFSDSAIELVGAVLRGRGGGPVAPGGVAGTNGARGGRPRADPRGPGGRRGPGRPVRRRPVVARAREPRLPNDGRGLVR